MRTRAIGRHQAVVGICLGLMLPISIASADSDELQKLGARWQQWVLSIPTSVNPQLDPTGENCMVGQRGALWFLAGTFGGGTATRTCSVPEGKSLFFPVVNAVNFNTPNVCGQGPGNLSVKELRAASDAFIDGVTAKSVELDGELIQNLLHLRSPVFEIALPEEMSLTLSVKLRTSETSRQGYFRPQSTRDSMSS
jgi:hypothetical protein